MFILPLHSILSIVVLLSESISKNYSFVEKPANPNCSCTMYVHCTQLSLLCPVDLNITLRRWIKTEEKAKGRRCCKGGTSLNAALTI